MTILDASAALAVINEEPGAERVKQALRAEAVISAVNLSEVVAKLMDAGRSLVVIHADIDTLALSAVDFDEPTAYEAGLLRQQTRHLGLSLGDRACLALARQLGAPVLTADRSWRDLNVGVEIEVIR